MLQVLRRRKMLLMLNLLKRSKYVVPGLIKSYIFSFFVCLISGRVLMMMEYHYGNHVVHPKHNEHLRIIKNPQTHLFNS